MEFISGDRVPVDKKPGRQEGFQWQLALVADDQANTRPPIIIASLAPVKLQALAIATVGPMFSP
jgi:hypothetical protein